MKSCMLPSDPKRLRLEAEHFMRDQFPDGGYVLVCSELSICCHNSLGGLASAGLALWHRSELEAAGRWRGMKPTVLLNDQALWRLSYDWYDGFLPMASAYFAHEVGHLFALNIVTFENDDGEAMSSIEAEYRKGLTEEAIPSVDLLKPDFSKPPWHLHDWRWIRAALHVGHRLAKDGWPIAIEHLFHGASYGLSAAWHYLGAIESELEALESMPVHLVLMTDPPSTFTALWASDTNSPIELPKCSAARPRGKKKPAVSSRKRKVPC